MDSTVTGKDYLEQFFTNLTALISRGLENLFGPGVNVSVFGNVTWADLGTVTFVLLFVALVHGLAIAFLRRKSRPATPRAGKELHHHFFGALGKPLYLLIWIYGVYLAATPLLVKLPADEGLRAVRMLFDEMFNLGAFAVVFWLFFRFTHVLEAWLAALTAKTGSKLQNLFVPLAGKALRVIVPVVGLIFALPLLDLPAEDIGLLAKGTSIILIAGVTLIAFQAVNICEKAVLTHYDVSIADNLHARKIYTQVHVIGRTLYVIIGLFALASVLMLFEEVRRLGTSLLASAGVVGVILGFAAQKTIANLFAGFQIALAQPMRLDDVVIVEGEWGRIEEITLTYVVIHIWDDRRLVVPLSYFIEEPFQNWTRVSAQLLGSVFVWVDYTTPLDKLRKALKEIIEPNPLWDKRFWNLQVTDTTEKTMQIRVLATAADSSVAWNLRCDIREKLIAYLQKNYPQSLPHLRTEISGAEVHPPLPP
jgi:small-conductance mechanosensitive channel